MQLSLKQIKTRIRSVTSTKKITHAMQIVSASKIKRTEDMLFAGKPYYFKLDGLLKQLLACPTLRTDNHPLLEERPEKKKFTLCIVTSDSGLCSTYNNNIISLAEDFINRKGPENTTLVTIGKKGFAYFKRRNIKISHAFLGLQGRFSLNVSGEISAALVDSFLSRKADEVYISHTHYDATLKYKPKLQKLLNIEKVAGEHEPDYLLEPDIDNVLAELVPKYISIKVSAILVDAFTSEHSQRMVAMKTATDNATELIDNLTLLRNKARQAAITTEIIEVSSAAEELKG